MFARRAATAAVLIMAACGGDAAAPDAATDPTPESTTAAAPDVLIGDLPAGTATYEVQLPDVRPERFVMTVTLPEGWTGVDGWVLHKNGGVEDRQGVAITIWGAPSFVYGDPCRWSDSAIEVEPTVNFMAQALATQQSRDASTPRELSVGGHRAVEVELTVPVDADISMCDSYEGEPSFQSWASADGSTARYHQGPGQRDRVRLIDVDGELVIVDVATWPELPADEHDEILSVLDSMTFEVVTA